MFRRAIPLAAACVALAISAALASAAEPATDAANAAVAYIRTLQNPDGGFPAFGAESTAGSTIDAVFALKAAGLDPTAATTNGNSAAEYLTTQAVEYASDPGGAAKLTLGVVAMGRDPRDFGGLDFLARMEESFDESTGAYGLDLFDHALYLLALSQAVGPVPGAAVDYLRSAQLADGGWEFSLDSGSDSNTTAIALQALFASKLSPDDPIATAALGYLQSAQNDDGGFGFLPGENSDPSSTAFAIQALAAAGEDVDEGRPWFRGGSTPLEALVDFQNPRTGAFQFGGEDSPFATYQAVPGLMLAPLPDLETRRPAEPSPSPEIDAPTATPSALPPAGEGVDVDGGVSIAVAVLAATGAAAIGAGALRRRSG